MTDTESTTTIRTSKLELLPVSLLDEQRMTVAVLKQLANSLELEFGWHYLLDLTWIISNLGFAAEAIAGKKILDAGAGTGVMQWYLADHDAEVFSVDRLSRSDLPVRFRNRFQVTGMRQGANPDLYSPGQMLLTRLLKPKKLAAQIKETLETRSSEHSSGRVIIYNQDLKHMTDIPDASMDAVVAVSALEHNPPADLVEVVDELMRVIKPGGVLLATLCASPDTDWFHEPSSGWCYTEATLRQAFKLPDAAPSNYSQYSTYMQALRDCAELRDNLASFYSKSGNNGMPWGKWDPQYQPVGVCKIKDLES